MNEPLTADVLEQLAIADQALTANLSPRAKRLTERIAVIETKGSAWRRELRIAQNELARELRR